jgi:hypothetical protein
MVKLLHTVDRFEWRRYFVWFPSRLYINGLPYRVWLETVERREIPDAYSTSFEYRFIENE